MLCLQSDLQAIISSLSVYAIVKLASTLFMCGNLDIVLDHFSRISQHNATLHAPCDMLSSVPMLIGCCLVLAIRCYFFRYLPLPFVAAMMLTITYGMPDWRLLAEMAKSNRVDFT